MASPYDAFDDHRNYLGIVIWMEKGRRYTLKELRAAIEYNGDKPIPQEILNYMQQAAEGKIETRTGRPAIADDMAEYVRRVASVHSYKIRLRRLQRRKATVGLEGWGNFKDADWWQGSPSERAVRMVRERIYPNLSWGTVRNIISEFRAD